MADNNPDTRSETRKVIIPLLQTRDADSPPKAEVDDASLQKTMDKNKESLKVKLMLRRPINQLVEQGIIPSLKTPPAFHEQRQKLERAKTGDILKHKIQQRPDRQELIQQHILEDSTVDPSLQDKQRQLKKARLADGLNDRISQRPGPLELIKGNILQIDESFAQAVKEGQITFRHTCEGHAQKHLSDSFSLDDDSGSDGAFCPSPPYEFNEHSQSSLPPLETIEPSPASIQESPPSTRTSFSLSPASSVSSPPSVQPLVISPPSQEQGIENVSTNNAQSKENISKNRKKPKPKAQPKARTIKFHEYKGPPNAQKNQLTASPAPAPVETSYDLLLQQQQLFLQWQLELQQKYPQVALPAAQKTSGDQISQNGLTNNSTNQQSQTQEPPASPQRLLSKLEDMKVSDLKAELKRRNLPVSGSKPQLIERLKSSESSQSTISATLSQSKSENITATTSSASTSLPVNVGGILLDALPAFTQQNDLEQSPLSPPSGTVDSPSPVSDLNGTDTALGLYTVLPGGTPLYGSRPSSTVPMEVDSNCNIPISSSSDVMDTTDTSIATPVTNDDIVRLHIKQLEEFQQQLHDRSPLQLHHSTYLTQSAVLPMVTSVTVPLNVGQSHQTIQSQVLSPTGATSGTVPNVSSSGSTGTTSTATTTTTASTSTVTTSTTTTTTATTSTPTSTVTTTSQGAVVDAKLLQRQLIHQQLQLKFAQNQQRQGAVSTTTPSSTVVNATLTALLQNRQAANSGMVSKSSSVAVSSATTTDSASLLPTAVIATQVLSSTLTSHTKSQSASQSYVLCQSSANATTCTSNSLLEKQVTVSPPNGLGNQRNSLPSFSALQTNKVAPVRQNTEPQFLITRPPPDYNEATKQLNKAKKQTTQNHFASSCQPKRHKSVKSQEVDDVLEILIKNGELPPSAAQEPPTPTTPGTPKCVQASPLPLFPSSTSAVTSDSTETCRGPPLTISSASVIHIPASSSQHATSLQSILSMTPPSSAGLVEPDDHTPTTLDFDFHLDVDDIEAMDLGVLTQDDPVNSVPIKAEPVTSQCILSQSSQSVNFSHLHNHNVEQSQYLLPNSSDLTDLHDSEMDIELPDWLEVIMPQMLNVPNSSSSGPTLHHSTYSIGNSHDPLLSNMASSHDPLDLFAIDDVDFKTPTDLSVLSLD